ncbi:DUF6268 family outer membrane beta-barrel protein [Flammeovirgaceae bacterium SG7u.111]|nr:DUF6268 family outer membrane beta-barrel protein [Flammeovirgaceae bacterium SG7u.132]WPO37264.1 DUF6268 family outer membrane beta-barrel protein [Flammeovirgaceae bacterium SG7u.111]
MIKKTSLLIVLQLVVLYAFGQQAQEDYRKHMMDSIKEAYIDELAFKTPAMRQLIFSTEYLGSGDISSKLNGDPFFDGTTQTTRYFVNMNIPITHIGKNSISGSIGVSHQRISMSEIESYNSDIQVHDMDIEKTVLNGSLRLTRVDSLFNRPIVYMVYTTGLIDPETSQIKLLVGGLGLLTLRKTQKSALSLGLVLTTDPTSPLPVIPFITYETKLSPTTDLSLGISGVGVRKMLGKKASIAFSNGLGGSLMLLQYDMPSFDGLYFPKKSTYSTLELKSGLTFEYLITKKTIFTLNTGATYFAASNTIEQGKASDPFIKNKLGIVPFAQVGVSFLPFWKGFGK